MKFFIDTANVDEIREAASWGLLDGVTTNPSLMARETGNATDILRAICEECGGPVSAEVISTDYEGMLREAHQLARLADNVVIKLPMTLDGLRATRSLTRDGIRTNLTLCFSLNQALMAAKAGATYVSPFVGRLDDLGQSGMELIEQVRSLFDTYGYSTQIIVASVRSPLHVSQSALIGADVATIPFKVLGQLVQHPLTDRGIEAFLADHARSQQG